MKLTLKIKLLPTDEQADLLLDTMKEANAVCNAISDVAWQEKILIISNCITERIMPIRLRSIFLLKCL